MAGPGLLGIKYIQHTAPNRAAKDPTYFKAISTPSATSEHRAEPGVKGRCLGQNAKTLLAEGFW